MLKTEDEARRLWCPYARIHSPTGAYNRGSNEAMARPPGSHCIAGSCMVWRWHGERSRENAKGETVQRSVGRCGLMPVVA